MKAVYSGLKEVFQLSDDAINIRKMGAGLEF